MLRPRASSAFICIRCELRLARPRLPPLFRRPSHASFSVSVPPRDALDTLDERLRRNETRSSKVFGQNSEPPSFTLWKCRGKTAVIERKEQLAGVKTLGQDAAILVIRKTDDSSRDDAPEPTQEITNDSEDLPMVLASLEAQAKKVSPEEVYEQLEALRPQANEDPNEPHYIDQATFLKLSKKLSKSFSVSQLTRYYSSVKDIETNKVTKSLLSTMGAENSQFSRTPWHPGLTSILRRLPGFAETRGSKRTPASKSLLVDQILRDVWRLVLLEEIEAPGEIEFTLKPWQLSLLNAGEANVTALDHIGSSRKAKIEIHWPHNVLRITADKSSAEYAAEDIEDVLKNVEQCEFHLGPWHPFMPKGIPKHRLNYVLSKADMDFASSVSRTYICSHSKNKLLIRGLDKSSVADAKRAILNMLPFTTSITHTMDTKLRDANEAHSYLVPHMFKSSMDYRFRKHVWARWTNPVVRTRFSSRPLENYASYMDDPAKSNSKPKEGKETHVDTLDAFRAHTATPIDFEPEEIEEMHMDTLDALKAHVTAYDSSAPLSSEIKENKWTLHPEMKFAADFGSILFPPSLAKEAKRADAATEISRTAFSDLVPGVAKMLATNDMPNSGPQDLLFLEYEFMPKPPTAKALANIELFPRLMMRFRPQNQAKLSRVELTFGERIHDVLLPLGAVDIRFRSSQRLCLRDPLADPNVKAFADAVCANIDSGAKLTAPEHLEIEIPRWLLPQFPRSDTGSQKVVYMFTQVNYRQTVETKLRDVTLAFNTVQGNKILGRRSPVSTYYHYRGGTRRESNMDEEAQAQFLEAQHQANEAGLTSLVKTSFDIAAQLTRAVSSGLSLTSEANKLKQHQGSKAQKATQQSPDPDIRPIDGGSEWSQPQNEDDQIEALADATGQPTDPASILDPASYSENPSDDDSYTESPLLDTTPSEGASNPTTEAENAETQDKHDHDHDPASRPAPSADEEPRTAEENALDDTPVDEKNKTAAQ